MTRFSEKVIVVTGGGSGLGRECALQWAAEGGSIVISDIVKERCASGRPKDRRQGWPGYWDQSRRHR